MEKKIQCLVYEYDNNNKLIIQDLELAKEMAEEDDDGY